MPQTPTPQPPSTQPRAVRPLAPRLPVRTLYTVSLSALALVVAGALTLWATGKNPPFQMVDDGWYRAVLGLRTPWLTDANLVLNFVGNDGMVIYAVVLFLVLLRRHRRLAFFTAGANVGTLLATQLIKALVGRQRPPLRLVQVDTGSYPSGHVLISS